MKTKLYLILYVLLSYGIVVGVLSLFGNTLNIFLASSIIAAFVINKIIGGKYEDT